MFKSSFGISGVFWGVFFLFFVLFFVCLFGFVIVVVSAWQEREGDLDSALVVVERGD
jgi:uncharacterized membrane protein